MILISRKEKKQLSLFEYKKLKEKGYRSSWSFLSIPSGVYTNEESKALKKLAEQKHDPLGFTITPNLISANNDDRIRTAINILTSSENKSKIWNIRKKSDYAWIKWVIDNISFRGSDNYKHKSNPTFVKLLLDLGCEKVPDDKTLARYYKKIRKHDTSLSFTDCHNDAYEARRRKSIAAKFLELMDAI